MRAFAGTKHLVDDEPAPISSVPIRPPIMEHPAKNEGLSGYRLAFLAWYLVSFFVWNGALFAFASRNLFPGPIGVGMLLWPLVVVACALPIAWILERQSESQHQRELANLEAHRQEAKLQLLVLQAQIEPHFLFNTLASIRALLREDIHQAEVAMDALVQHLRAVLPTMREKASTSTLSAQLAICSSYLQLMAIRLDNRFTWRINVTDSLMEAEIPPLMLLTLVENAIKHGIEPVAGAGEIRIEASRFSRPAGAFIEVRVFDTGTGVPTASGLGLGLQNLQDQLALRYGDLASISLRRQPGGGTRASLILPLTGTAAA